MITQKKKMGLTLQDTLCSWYMRFRFTRMSIYTRYIWRWSKIQILALYDNFLTLHGFWSESQYTNV